jgi:hypothetical protein
MDFDASCFDKIMEVKRRLKSGEIKVDGNKYYRIELLLDNTVSYPFEYDADSPPNIGLKTLQVVFVNIGYNWMIDSFKIG